MLTATAVCRRASSIKVRISINNLWGSWLFRSKSFCVILTLLLCSPDPRYSIDLGSMVRFGRRASSSFLSFLRVNSAIVQQAVAQLRGRNETVWADPPRLSPRPNWFRNLVSIWCQTAPILPILPVYNHLPVNNLRFCSSMAWKRSSVRSRLRSMKKTQNLR
jgi:hypothetical protein